MTAVFDCVAAMFALAVGFLIIVKGRFTIKAREFCGIVQLRMAVLCMDCNVISDALGAECPLCLSGSLLALAPVLNRKPEDEPQSWLCFHCGFKTSDEAEAEAHFGDRDDGEEFKPLCRWRQRMTPEERGDALQDVTQQLNDERRTSNSLRVSNEGLECQVGAQESAIRSYRPFKECRSINDVFFVYDSMEGRALAAEERLKASHETAAPVVPQKGETLA